MLEPHVNLRVALELDLVILDPEWSGSGRTRALELQFYTQIERVLYLNQKEIKGGRIKIY